MNPEKPDQGPPDYYAVLGLARGASPRELTLAFRQRAKLLHPDMPGTGDKDAFQRLQEAYHVLGDPARRAAYDQTLLADTRPAWRQEETRLDFVAPVTWRFPRFLGLGLAAVILLALWQVGQHFMTPAPPRVTAVVSRPVPALPTPDTESARETPPPPALLAGDHFIGPAASPAALWRRAPDRPGYVRAGQLEAFTPVAVLQSANAEGRAEIRANPGISGFVEATRLVPGDAKAARRASCLYHAGAAPRGGSLLVRPSGGPGLVAVENREDRPAVLTLRGQDHKIAGSAYLTARGKATIDQLPPSRYQVEFAVGDLWSAECGMFMAGMRAKRIAEPMLLKETARLIISATTAAEDISDDAFARK